MNDPDSPRLPPATETCIGAWSLSMAWWSLFSAMFWLYVSGASAAAYGVRATLVGLVITIVSYGVINRALAAYSLRTGETVAAFSERVFGRHGATMASLLLAATALYYGVFEGSVIAVALQTQFGGDIRLWYAGCVAYMMPLLFGGVRNWLDRLNGFLLPFYVIGLVALVGFATVRQGYPRGWLSATAPATVLPGWVGATMTFMGVWVMMMYTMDFAALGRREDTRFHQRFTFGPLFYACTFGVNGLIGIYVVSAFRVTGTETGVVQAVVGALGVVGVALVVVSQTRINTANYFLAANNVAVVVLRLSGRRLPHLAAVLICGAVAYSLMLTDVLGYLLHALAWQAVLIVAWVAVALPNVVGAKNGGATATDRGAFAAAWAAASVLGVAAQQQSALPALSELAPLVTLIIGLVVAATIRYTTTRRNSGVGVPSTTSTEPSLPPPVR